MAKERHHCFIAKSHFRYRNIFRFVGKDAYSHPISRQSRFVLVDCRADLTLRGDEEVLSDPLEYLSH